MADKTTDKPADPSGRSDRPVFTGRDLKSFLKDLVFYEGIVFAWHLIQKILEHKADYESREVPKRLRAYEEALVVLRETDPYSYDKLTDFLQHELTGATDRHRFKVNAGKLGGQDTKLTVGFLQLLAHAGDFADMRDFLLRNEFIGEGSRDLADRMKGWGGQALTALGSIAASMGEAAVAVLSQIGEFFQDSPADVARMQAELTRLRGQNAQPLPPLFNFFRRTRRP